MQGLQLAVGQSRLWGSGTLDLSGPRPLLALQVSAPSVQLDDFPLPPRIIDPPPGQQKVGDLLIAGRSLAARTDSLLSARFLRRLDASVDVRANQLAGADHLADGAIVLRLRDGRLDIDPAVVNLPGGSVRVDGV